MNENKMEKGIYEAPVIKKQQVILEQAIAGSRPISSDYGALLHEWTDEEIDDNIVLQL
ncbi:MAG: hypothetical protein LUI85_16700 [Bacteroides sp.]|nr:hypothetical protein [Bacteroides sp.]